LIFHLTVDIAAVIFVLNIAFLKAIVAQKSHQLRLLMLLLQVFQEREPERLVLAPSVIMKTARYSSIMLKGLFSNVGIVA
jgi:hypothetical protein